MLYPNYKQFSRYYSSQERGGATRLDRIYISENEKIISSDYFSVPFSDHWGHWTQIKVNSNIFCKKLPKPKFSFKIKPKIVDDISFQNQVKVSISQWKLLRTKDNILDWWELLVKPGIKNIAINRTREINKSSTGRLNFLYIKQLYYNKLFHQGNLSIYNKLIETNYKINA